MKKRNGFALLMMILTLLFSGCAAQTDGQKVIVTSFYPMYILTQNVAAGIDGVTVQNMAEQNVGCLHDYQLQTRDMVTLEGAGCAGHQRRRDGAVHGQGDDPARRFAGHRRKRGH